MSTQSARRLGFSLVEMLCVMSLLGVLGVVMAFLLKHTLDVEHAQASSFNQMLRVNTLADQFRADVAAAESAPQAWMKYKADASTLILTRKDGTHIVYQWHDKKLHRFDFERPAELEWTVPIDPIGLDVEFVHATAKSKVIRMRLRSLRNDKPAPGEALEIAAALGGDWR